MDKVTNVDMMMNGEIHNGASLTQQGKEMMLSSAMTSESGFRSVFIAFLMIQENGCSKQRARRTLRKIFGIGGTFWTSKGQQRPEAT